MSGRGKKFDAAEKHFEKKRIKYEAEIKSLKSQVENAHRDTRHFRSLYEITARENEELKEWIERLLEYTELSKDDIKAVCEKDKRMGEAMNWLSRFGGMFQGYI